MTDQAVIGKPTSTQRGYPVISADSHFTEPVDLWDRLVEPRFRGHAPHVVSREDTDVIVCDGADMFPVGVIHGVRYKGGDVQLNGRYSDVPASGWDPEARIVELKVDGIATEVLYPTIAMRFFTISDPELQDACIRAYNTWAAEFCRNHSQWFHAVGIIALEDMPSALREMERCKELGHVGVMIAFHPAGDRPYDHEYYLPFWERAAALGLPVSLHTATERRVAVKLTPTETFLQYTLVQRTLIGLIYAGVFDRYPTLQVVSVENDAGWAANIIERMDYVEIKARARNLQGNGHLNREAPSHYWHKNIMYTFMRDKAAIAARDIIGVDRLMWSSDFPHGDSTWPDSQAVIDEQMVGVPDAEQRMMLHDNAARLYGLS
ncbi:MAG TPA: amidohydrolase family protein [Candidatus Dormibacteraeota bacterium]|nr:amidohydrolase family protein [Candidatus Dormibacteraeota bacterium]